MNKDMKIKKKYILDVIRIIPVKIGLIREGEDPIRRIVDAISSYIEEKDVLVIATKPLLIAYGKVMDLKDVEYGESAASLAGEYDIDPRFAELIIRYSKGIYGGVSEAILTNVDDIIIANAGIDRKNVGRDRVALPFTELRGVAEKFYRYVYENYGVRIGIIISDSMVSPLRRGTKSVAVYIYGFKPVRDYRGREDLYGRRIRFTQFALADSLASAAHIVIGEGSEAIPAALVKGVDIELIDGDTTDLAKVRPEECIYTNLYK